MNPFDDNNDDEFPILFHEALGENILSEDIRNAIVWASILKFLPKEEYEEIETGEISGDGEITDKQKKLAQSIVFHGPMNSFEKALELSQSRQAVVVSPKNQWTDERQPIWLACLSN